MRHESIKDAVDTRKRLTKAAKKHLGVKHHVTLSMRVDEDDGYTTTIYVWDDKINIVHSLHDTKLTTKQLINWIKGL